MCNCGRRVCAPFPLLPLCSRAAEEAVSVVEALVSDGFRIAALSCRALEEWEAQEYTQRRSPKGIGQPSNGARCILPYSP